MSESTRSDGAGPISGGNITDSLKDALLALTSLAGLMAIYAYFAGLSYLRAFYDSFSIDVSLVEPSVYDTIAYGAFPLRQHGIEFIVYAMFVGIGALAIDTLRATQLRSKLGIRLRTVGMVIFLLVGVALLFRVGDIATQTGDAQANRIKTGAEFTAVEFTIRKKAHDDYTALFYRDNSKHLLELFAESKDHYFVIRRGASTPRRETMTSAVRHLVLETVYYRVTKTDVGLLRFKDLP
jgi:hypothetical protein